MCTLDNHVTRRFLAVILIVLLASIGFAPVADAQEGLGSGGRLFLPLIVKQAESRPDILDPFSAADGNLDGSAPTDHGGRGAARWSAPHWAISSNQALATPGESADKLINGAFEGVPPDGWTNNASTLNERSTEQVHGGTYARKLAAGTGQGIYQVPPGLTSGRWGKHAAWIYPTAGSVTVNAFGRFSAVANTYNQWQQRFATGRFYTGATAVSIYGATAGSTWYADDAAVKELTTADLFATLDTGMSDSLHVSAGFTIPVGYQAGIVMGLDSPTDPRNYVLAWRDGDGVKLDKVVGGVVTNLYSGVSIYNAGARMALEKNGTTFRLFYDGGLVTTQTVADAGIVTNARHGLFSTSALTRIDGFRARSGRVQTVTIIGDSISAGSAFEPADWTYQLVRSAEVGAVLLKNHAVNAQSIMSHMDAQTSAAAADNADIIVVALGTNDADDAGITAEYQENLNELKSTNSHAVVYAMGILPRGGGLFGVGKRAENNPRIAAGAAAAGVTFWNTDGWIDPATDTSDGLHPTEAGALKILAEVLSRVSL